MCPLRTLKTRKGALLARPSAASCLLCVCHPKPNWNFSPVGKSCAQSGRDARSPVEFEAALAGSPLARPEGNWSQKVGKRISPRPTPAKQRISVARSGQAGRLSYWALLAARVSFPMSALPVHPRSFATRNQGLEFCPLASSAFYVLRFTFYSRIFLRTFCQFDAYFFTGTWLWKAKRRRAKPSARSS
jgi:hypothetical protein